MINDLEPVFNSSFLGANHQFLPNSASRKSFIATGEIANSMEATG